VAHDGAEVAARTENPGTMVEAAAGVGELLREVVEV
jgi:hypothetical protein